MRPPGHFIFYEIFANEADFEAHNAMPYVQEWFAKLPELADGGVTVMRMEVLVPAGTRCDFRTYCLCDRPGFWCLEVDGRAKFLERGALDTSWAKNSRPRSVWMRWMTEQECVFLHRGTKRDTELVQGC